MKRLFTTAITAAILLGLVASPLIAKPAKRSNAWLGVYTQSVDRDISDAFELEIDYGAIVNEVLGDSPADEAGIKDGDVIISFDGRKVWDQDDLLDFIEDKNAGESVALELFRDGKSVTVNVELGKRPRSKGLFSRAPRAHSRNLVFSDPGHGKYRHFSSNRGGYIGVSLTSLSEQLADYFGVKNNNGVLITEVAEDSPAQKAGLKAGDVIVAIEDEEISNYADVKEIVGESDQGDKLTFTILRNKRKKKIEVEVGESEDSSFGFHFFTGPDIAIIPDIPDIPDIDIYIPKAKGRFNRFNRDHKSFFDYDEFLEDMGEFKEEMAEFKKEMKDLHWKFKRLEKEDRRELKTELDKLRKELRKMEKKLD